MRYFAVAWETDNEKVYLPTHVYVPDDVRDEEISEYLSALYGWLVSYLEEKVMPSNPR